MIASVEFLIVDLKGYFQQLSFETKTTFEKAQLSLVKLAECRKRLHELRFKKFESTEQEIMYFKFLKPSIYSLIYYYSEVYEIEALMPPGSNKKIKEYLKSHYDKIDRYYEENKKIYYYFKTSSKDLDEQYFTSVNKQLGLILPSQICCCEEELSSIHDETFSKIIANNMLVDYLKSSIENLKDKSIPDHALRTDEKIKSIHRWSESESSAVELVIALKAFVDDGNVELKEFADSLGQVLGFKITDINKKKYKLKGRGKQSIFIDKMKDRLELELSV